jgi:hypothetical protein
VIYSDFNLSPLETALLAAWERERKRFITLAELRERLGPKTRSTIDGLVEKRLLERNASISGRLSNTLRVDLAQVPVSG